MEASAFRFYVLFLQFLLYILFGLADSRPALRSKLSQKIASGVQDVGVPWNLKVGNRGDTPLWHSSCRMAEAMLTTKAIKTRPAALEKLANFAIFFVGSGTNVLAEPTHPPRDIA